MKTIVWFAGLVSLPFLFWVALGVLGLAAVAWVAVQGLVRLLCFPVADRRTAR
ncbi:hypothetical protein BSNK01_17830 [Bacillaceae bacterium]